MTALAPMLVVPTSQSRDPAVRFCGSASFQDWRSTLRAYGRLLDRTDAADTYIADTEAQLSHWPPSTAS